MSKNIRRFDGDHSAMHGIHKLLPNEQIELVKRIAWHWKPSKIRKFILDEYGKRLHDTLIFQYSRTEKWKPIIEKFREEYYKNVTEVPLANKRKRLDELQDLYERAIDKKNYNSARDIIKDFRDEMEKRVGELSLSFTSITNEFNQMTDEQLINEKQKTIEQLERIRKMKLITGE